MILFESVQSHPCTVGLPASHRSEPTQGIGEREGIHFYADHCELSLEQLKRCDTEKRSWQTFRINMK